jgi:NAD(P)-dependent dehydrogenase (short-subunit alcohol dehydrogenase family)
MPMYDLKPLDEQVIVITGASSGIGLATARAAAREGARVVLSARNGAALAEAEAGIRGAGGEAIHVVADVANRADVERIARTAVERFGGFDTWVNDAGVSIWGRLEDVSDEDNRRLFDTNFWGLVNGSLVAARHLETKGGAIINLGSVASDVALPLQGMYCASKHAVKGFTDVLRMELEEKGAPVSVTLIKPGAIDTPFPHHARNYTDREPKLPGPVYVPTEVANAILHAAVHPRRDIYVGGSAKVMSVVNRLAPRLLDWAGTQQKSSQLSSEPPRNPSGALFRPGTDDGRIRGGHPGYVMGSSLYTRSSLHPLASSFAVGIAGLAALAFLGSGRRNRRPVR